MQIKAEPVGDLAVLNRLIEQTNLSSRFEEYFTQHHLWQGMSIGKTLQCLLMYTLSENDHRLYNLEGWAAEREKSLACLLGEPGFTAKQLNDDRLGRLLDLISSSEEAWEAFQGAHNRALIRFYDLSLSPQGKPSGLTARIDSTTARSFREAGGLFQMGHNAQGIALPQIKVLLLAIDQGDLPLALNAVSGQQTDDNQYLPVLELAWRQGLPRQDTLIVGDRKLGNKTNMCIIAQSGNYYLTPLAERQFSKEELSQACQWISQQTEEPQEVKRMAAGAKQAEAIALCKELPERVVSSSQGQEHRQRLIAVCSLNKRQRDLNRLAERMEKAKAAVQKRFTRKRGRKTLKKVEEARQAAEKILAGQKVQGLFDLGISPPSEPNEPCKVKLSLNQEAYENEKRMAGWRVMATNADEQRLSAQEVVLCYWEEYRIEQQFHLLLNKCTALQPIFLRKENRILAMLKVLMLALQYSNLWQYSLRQKLEEEPQPYLLNLVPGNPGMKVHRPTTKLVLAAFKNIQAIYVDLPGKQRFVQIQGLEQHHQRLLRLLKLPNDIYSHPLCQ